jgi:predicted metal-dependent peptidase
MLMIGKKLTAHQRLEKALVDILAVERFTALSGVLLLVKHQIQNATTPTPRTSTACTNGIECTYAEAFVDSMTDADLRFLILHETYHCMFKHLTTWEHLYNDDPSLANQACDHVINLFLLEAADELEIKDAKYRGFLTMPAGGCADRRFAGMDSAMIFRLLKQEQDQPQQPQQPQDGGEGQGEGDDGDDGDESQDKDSGSNPSSGNKPSKNKSRQGFDDHDWDGAAELTEEKKAEIGRKMDEAVRQGALLAGKVGSGGMREIEELLKSKVRWQDALREYLHATCTGNEFSTWRRPNRRFVAAGVYMPSGISETIGEMVVGVDTSGSIGGPELGQFLGEIAAICTTVQPEAVRLLYWDTAVCKDERYARDELDTLVKTTKPAGGGGTSPDCVTTYLSENNIKPQVCVMLTDGYVGNNWGGSWPCPVVWCVVGNASAEASVGKTIHVEWNE